MFEVVSEITPGAVKLAKVHAKQTTITELDQVFGIDNEHHVDHGKAFIDRVALYINVLQIIQHAPHNLPVCSAGEKAIVEFHGFTVLGDQPFPAILPGKDLAAIVRVQK